MARNWNETLPTTGQDRYFVPGEVHVLVEHEPHHSPSTIANNIHEILGAQSTTPPNRANIQDHRIISFQHAKATNTLAQMLAAKTQAKQLMPLRTSSDLHSENAAQLRPTASSFAMVPVTFPTTPVIDIIDTLNSQLFAGNTVPASFSKNGITIRAISPNWLAMPQPDNGGGSGPGGLPTPYTDTVAPDYAIVINNLPGLGSAPATGQGVEVAILDSAPTSADLQSAYQEYGSNHPLLGALLAPNGTYGSGNALEVVYASSIGATLPDPNDIRIPGHNYPMTDHGLFAAGIIRTIAPQAKIRLIEVLNTYGVGTVDSIGKGLLWLMNERANQASPAPLVVNMSLMLATPMAGHPINALAQQWGFFSSVPGYNNMYLRGLNMWLEWLCAALRSQGVTLIASAGNDNDDPEITTSGTIAPARFPAAFNSVLGVGALLENSDQPASYSNMADRPSGTGVATFGGAKSTTGESPAQSGMLGVYISSFPQRAANLQVGSSTNTADSSAGYTPVANTNGWGWWSGTSFSAPVISAAIAALVPSAGSLELAEKALAEACETPQSTYPVGGILRAHQP